MAVIKEDQGDAGADAQTQYALSLGDVFQGTLQSANDKDWLKVELSAETIYDFTLSGVGGKSAELALFASDGNRIVSGGPIPSGAKLIFSPVVTGTYYLHVGGYDDSLTGDYELALVENMTPVGSYDEIADYLTDGYYEERGGWGSTRSFNVRTGGTLTANITALSEDNQKMARWGLEAWANVTGIQFRFVDHDDADIIFDNHESHHASGYLLVNNGIVSGYLNFPESFLITYGATVGSRNFMGFLHELGHALGLAHAGAYSGYPVYYGHHNVFVNDSQQLSVMSYLTQAQNTYITASMADPVTPMIADIIAIQKLYGVPDTINTGDTIYGYQSNLDGYLGEFFRLWTGEANPFSGITAPSNFDYQALKPTLVDLDGDSDPDLVLGNNTGLLYYFENTGTPANLGFAERAGTANPLDGLSVGSYSAPAFVDLDGDGDVDLIVGNGQGNIIYFENTGTANAPSFTQGSGATNPFDGISIGIRSTLALVDLDSDGDQDLVVGTNDGSVPYYENTGTSANPEFTLRTGTSSPTSNITAGSYVTPAFIDVDGDNDFDLVVGNNDGDILYFENTGTTTEPSFTPLTDFDNPFHATVAGYWIGLDFADINGDGHPDLIVGNDDGIIHYFEHAGTPETPEFTPQSLAYPTAFTIYDNGGTDTLDLRTDTQDQRIHLRPEGISDVYGLTGNMIIARDTWIENVIAGSGHDMIAGNAIANDLNGRAGNDRIWGSGGHDILEGGAGADRLNGDAGMDWAAYRDSDAAVTINLAEGTVQGGHAEGDVLTGIENIIGSAHDDVLVGDDEANRLAGGAGADRLDGGAGEDWASYQWSDEGVNIDLAEGTAAGGHAQGDVIVNMENVMGSDHGDVLWGDSNANRLAGEGGDDRLWGAGGDDVLAGGDGDDRLLGSPGADQLDGGAGFDVLSYELSGAGVTVNLEEGTLTGGDAEGDIIADIERVMGSEYRDVLTGDSGANELYGLGGDDELLGRGGDDRLEGGTGADRLDGGAGLDRAVYVASDAGVTVNLADNTVAGGHAQGDTITGIENLAGSGYRDVLTGDSGPNELHGAGGDDELQGDAGNDVLEGGPGADRLDGGPGADWLSYRRSDAGVTIDLRGNTAAGGHAEGDAVSGFENIAGSAYPDVLTGDDGANELAGNGGDDDLRGNGGDDVLAGGAGADRLDGGVGTDTLSYRLSVAGVRVNLAEGTAAGGHAEGDTFAGVENVTGSGYRDVLTGDTGANHLDGLGGDDQLFGGPGADRLVGNTGDDELRGAEGDDELRGNAGNDQLFGESGADVLYGAEGDDDLHGGEHKDQLFGGADADTLYGDDGDDELHGGDGDDRLHGNAGADRLDGGRGIDWASYLGSGAAVRINLASGTAGGGEAEGDVLTAIENLVGSGYDDVLRGDGLANELHGLNGADELYGNGGDDVLQGGAGADRLEGGSGNDTALYKDSDVGVFVDLKYGNTGRGHAEGDVLTGIENVTGSAYDDDLRGDEGANRLLGGDGRDVLHGGGGADWLDGGGGIRDWVGYWESDSAVTVNLLEGTGKGGHAEGDIIRNVEIVDGTDYGDVLIGDHKDNGFQGFGGDDDIRGNDGDDYLSGGEGRDRLDGGEGSDMVSYWDSDTGVTVNLEEGTGEGGHAEGDVIVNIERIEGSSHGDVLTGDDDHNYIYGLAGADRIIGGAGNDRLHGNTNSPGEEDREGNTDVFVFDVGHGNDSIYYFVDNEDKIDLSAFDLSGFDDLVLFSDYFGVTTIDLSDHGGGTIKLFEFDIANLDATDFLF
ncbi:MAG: FG-GAP-like repeat-containing protein [Gammaproteobacteria bacterium]|nr:FG-GAP-like repeat-containing protein [Gammaproteobacteria bacterium]MDE0286071.1 FG-GAP-like repeat-containing protein [Gammaproteobacteria bacterium]